MYLGGAYGGDGKTETEKVSRKVQAGANAWRAVERVMADRRISKRLKNGGVKGRDGSQRSLTVRKAGEEEDWKKKTRYTRCVYRTSPALVMTCA